MGTQRLLGQAGRMPHRLGRWAMIVLALLTPASTGAAPSIFDEDWKPPTRSSPTSPPAAVGGSVSPSSQPPSTASQPPASVKPASPKPTPAVAPLPAAKAGSVRRKVPVSTAQAKSRELLKEAYAEQLKDRTTPGRVKLAKELLIAAGKMADQPVDQFVVLGGAITAATEAANLPLCFEAAEAMASAYEVDAVAIKLDALIKAKAPPAQSLTTEENTQLSLEFVSELIGLEDYSSASRVLAALQTAASAKPQVRSAIQSKSREVNAGRMAYERMLPAAEKLRASPGDPASSLTVGTYNCFYRNRWDLGLAYLVSGSHPGLKSAAILDLASPKAMDKQIEAGDAWWALSEKETWPVQSAMRARAAEWYAQAKQDAALAGLSRVKIDKRLAIAEQDPPLARSGSGSEGGEPGWIAVGTLESRKPPILAGAEGAIPFKAPNHDRWWVGSNGVLLSPDNAWEKIGTAWVAKKFIMRPWGVKFVHPFQDGQVVVGIGEKGVSVQAGGAWGTKDRSVPIGKTADYEKVIPFERDRAYSVRTDLSPGGELKVTIDDKLIATATVSAAEPLSLTGGFEGDSLPQTFKKGQAAVIVEHSYHLGNTVVGEIALSPGKRSASHPAGSGKAFPLKNTTAATEGQAIIDELRAHFPKRFEGVSRAVLVRVHDASEMRRNGGGPTQIEGAYSATPLKGGSGGPMWWGIYEKYEAGRYLVAYRMQSFSPLTGERYCFLDICESGNTFAEYRPPASDFSLGKWTPLPVSMELKSARTVEFRLWPDGHQLALDRIYIFAIE